MELLDEQGRVFGVVNVVDLLALLFTLAVVVAGLVVVFGVGTSSPTDTRYATLDLGTQPAYVAALVTQGDTVDRPGTENLTVTDVYATGNGSDRHVRVRVRITGQVDEDTLVYAGDPLRVGRDLSLATGEYEASGTVMAVDDSTPSLPVETTDVLLQTTLPAETAAALQSGDEYRVDGRTVGTVESVTVYGTGDSDAVTALVGVTYRTYSSGNGPQFGETPVREGATLPVETEAHAFEGEVVRVGALAPRGQEATRTVRLELEGVDPDLASSLRAGMTERVRGETVARLTDVRVQPATVVLTSQDGDVYRREHPVQKDVALTADLRVRETGTGVRFKGAPLRQGGTVTLDFGTVTVNATVVRV